MNMIYIPVKIAEPILGIHAPRVVGCLNINIISLPLTNTDGTEFVAPYVKGNIGHGTVIDGIVIPNELVSHVRDG